MQFDHDMSKNMKEKDLEAEAILAPSVFILGAQEKCKMEAKDINCKD